MNHCTFRLDSVDGTGREWCTCARLKTHPVHAPLPPSPAEATALEARRFGEYDRDEDQGE